MVHSNAKKPMSRRMAHPHPHHHHRRFASDVRFNTYKIDNGFELHLAVPGIDKEGLSISMENGLLVVNHENESTKNPNNGCIQQNFNYVGFTKKFNLPENTDTDAIQASYENGVLKITLPVKEKFQKKNITVQ